MNIKDKQIDYKKQYYALKRQNRIQEVKNQKKLLLIFFLTIILIVLSIHMYIMYKNTKALEVENNFLKSQNSQILKESLNTEYNTRRFLNMFSRYVYINSSKEKKIESSTETNTDDNPLDSLNISYTIDAIATAYDLSVQCCGKTSNDNGYGLTKLGINLVNQTRESAMVISVDPKIIPLGTYVYIEFENDTYLTYNGIYLACDTGSAIKGNKIDLFIGDFNSESPSDEAINFGVAKCKLYVLENYNG